MAQYLDTTGLKTFWNKIKNSFLSISGGSLQGNLDMEDNGITFSGTTLANTITAGYITMNGDNDSELTSEGLTCNGSTTEAALSSTGVSLTATLRGETVNDAYFKNEFSKYFTFKDVEKYNCLEAHILHICSVDKNYPTAMVAFTVERSEGDDDPMYCYYGSKCIGACYPNDMGIGTFIVCVPVDDPIETYTLSNS